ncbi:ABC transporter permease [Actinoplanes sp. NPDC049599]|uniref:ABC transporter permease n=1 Tax=Actinoplanes sp. NPDC049599 TaxID=3363903 RepID=UPI00379E7357
MKGTGQLIRLILRRDRALLPLWVVPLAVIPAGFFSSFDALFPTDAERLTYARVSAENAGFVALYGPLHGSSLGELVAWRAGFIPVMIALFSVLTIIRHTRADEEAGRTELVGAAAVSRHAGLFAAVIVTFAADAVLALILAPVMIAQGLPVTGSVLLALEFMLAGWMFAAVAAVAAQLAGGARAARSIALLVLGVAYVLRLAGDVSGIGDGATGWLSWLSPIGWVQRLFPYGADVWWPIIPAVGLSALLVGAAVVLAAHRDIGVGVLPTRPGPAVAASGLRSPLALAWRLHRGMLAGWVSGFALLGLVFGGVAGSIGDLVADSPELAEIFTRLGGAAAAIDSFFAGVTGILGLIAAGYAVQAVLRLRDEESAGHAEMLLTTGTSRWRWLLSHAVFAFLGPAVALAVAGAVTGLVHGLASGDVGGQVLSVLGGALAQVPAVWVLAAVAAALFGLVPRLTPAAWGAVAGCVLVLLFGAAMQLSQWVLDISPFSHVPHLPGGHATATPFVILTLIAVLLAAAGLAGFRRRDLPT